MKFVKDRAGQEQKETNFFDQNDTTPKKLNETIGDT